MTSVRRALGLSVIERFALIALNLISYVIIARLLTPHEIGLYSVAAALVGILQVLREFGIGNYLIQTKDLTQERLDSALGVSLGLGLMAFIASWVASPWAADFYGDAEVSNVLRVAALNFLLLPLCSIGQSLLRRALRFDSLLHSSVAGGVFGFIATLGLAFHGTGPASLAWGSVATNLVIAAICWNGLPADQRPHRPRWRHWRELMHFGRSGTAAAVVTTVAVDINDLVIGRLLGLAPVALLSRAMGLMNMWQRDLMQAARNVALPAFAKAHREGQPLEPLFLHSYAAVLACSLPYYGFVGLFPLESLRLLAGPQWDAALPMVGVFAVAGAFLSVNTLIPTLLIAAGRVELAAAADIIYAGMRVLVVVATALLSRDLMYVSIAFLAAYAVSPLVFLYYKHRCVPIDLRGMREVTLRTLAVTATCLVPALAVSLAWGWGRQQPMPLALFLGTAAAVPPLWLLALRWWGHPVASDPVYLRAVAALRTLLRRVRRLS
jgi:O-antigen/teichoic acid export membrane protein